jgi:4-amino-4-deoxychorismate lyase
MSPPNFQLFSSLRYDPALTTHPFNSQSPYYMLSYHRDRLLQAATHFGWTTAAQKISGEAGFAYLLSTLNAAISNSTSPLRVRTLLDHDGHIQVESHTVPEVSLFNLYPERIPEPRVRKKVEVSPLTGGTLELGENDAVHGSPEKTDVYDVLPDIILTTPSPYTSYKTTSRGMYTSARERVGIPEMTTKKEVCH